MSGKLERTFSSAPKSSRRRATGGAQGFSARKRPMLPITPFLRQPRLPPPPRGPGLARPLLRTRFRMPSRRANGSALFRSRRSSFSREVMRNDDDGRAGAHG